MKILILGATGNVGGAAMREALGVGVEVVAYARRPQALAPAPGLTVVGGELADVAALAAAADGVDAVVVSVTGSPRDGSFAQRTLPGIIDATRRAGVSRLVQVSAFGAGDTAAKASWFARLIYRRVLGGFFRDKAIAEALLPASGLDYVVVYPVNLKAAPALAEAAVVPIEEVASVPGLPTLPFANAGRAVLQLATATPPASRRVLVTTPSGVVRQP